MRWAIAILFTTLASAQTRQIALTFDDAPRGGDAPAPRELSKTLTLTQSLIRSLHQIPATIFANPGQARELGEEGVEQILRLWHDAGFQLGNHTFSHADLNKIPLAEY
jgi:peptidoglycan/xylan/chitin deacetylase (PgdA/CDA1 family)